MAKDPALLWYFSDWFSGTATLTRHQKGAYMDLLSVQFNQGKLTLDEIKTVLGSDFGSTWPALQKKFKFDDNLYFNERLQEEKDKRANYTESRRKNARHMPKHMEDINEDININLIKNKYGEFKNVLLTQEELEKLFKRFGENNTGILTEELSRYITSIGKDKYKSHYATIITWGQKKIVDHINKPIKGKQVV